MMLLPAIFFGIIGALLLVLAGVMWLRGDNSDAKAMAMLPLYLSRWPIGLAALCMLIHWL